MRTRHSSSGIPGISAYRSCAIRCTPRYVHYKSRLRRPHSLRRRQEHSQQHSVFEIACQPQINGTSQTQQFFLLHPCVGEILASHAERKNGLRVARCLDYHPPSSSPLFFLSGSSVERVQHEALVATGTLTWAMDHTGRGYTSLYRAELACHTTLRDHADLERVIPRRRGTAPDRISREFLITI